MIPPKESTEYSYAHRHGKVALKIKIKLVLVFSLELYYTKQVAQFNPLRLREIKCKNNFS